MKDSVMNKTTEKKTNPNLDFDQFPINIYNLRLEIYSKKLMDFLSTFEIEESEVIPNRGNKRIFKSPFSEP